LRKVFGSIAHPDNSLYADVILTLTAIKRPDDHENNGLVHRDLLRCVCGHSVCVNIPEVGQLWAVTDEHSFDASWPI